MLNILSKYDYTDAPISIPIRTGDLTSFTDFTTTPITNLQVVPNVSWDGITNITKLQVTWDGSNVVGRSDTYSLMWVTNDGIVHEVTHLTSPSYDILNPTAGTYNIAVKALHGITKLPTVAVTTIYSYKIDSLSTLLPPVNPVVVGSSSLIVTSTVIKLAWDYNTGNNSIEDKLVSYLVEVYNEVPTELISSYEVIVLPNIKAGLSLDYSEVYAIFGDYPRKITFKVFSKDTFGYKSSTSLDFTIENPVPAVQSFTVTPLERAIQVIIDSSTNTDTLGYNVYTSLTSGGARTLVYSGKERFIVIPQTEVPTVLKYVTVDAYDLLGTSGLLTSPEQTVTALVSSSGSSASLTRDSIGIGETFTITIGYQLIVVEELFNSGEILNNNMVFII